MIYDILVQIQFSPFTSNKRKRIHVIFSRKGMFRRKGIMILQISFMLCAVTMTTVLTRRGSECTSTVLGYLHWLRPCPGPCNGSLLLSTVPGWAQLCTELDLDGTVVWDWPNEPKPWYKGWLSFCCWAVRQLDTGRAKTLSYFSSSVVHYLN